MSISIKELVSSIDPKATALLLGAGSSIPSGAPSASDFVDIFGAALKEDLSGYGFNDAAEILEIKKTRKDLVKIISDRLKNLKPTGGILNIHHFDWRVILTTNYDELIERSFSRVSKEITVISSDFDFHDDLDDTGLKLFKIHGTIYKDTSYGFQYPMLITSHDYTSYSDWRRRIYAHLFPQMIGSNVVIIGHSLSDPHINKIIEECIEIKTRSASSTKIYCLIYSKDETKSLLLERRGIKVSFGSLDEFVSELMTVSSETKPVTEFTGNPLDVSPRLHSTVIDVQDAIIRTSTSIKRMIEGSPVPYEDALGLHVFERDAPEAIKNTFDTDQKILAYVIGAAGVGKTSSARMFLAKRARNGEFAWEHQNQFAVSPELWAAVARELDANKKVGYIFFDEYQKHSRNIDRLIDLITSEGRSNLRIIIACHPAFWNTRSKTPNIFASGKGIFLKKLSDREIENLVDLHAKSPLVAQLSDSTFSGYSRNDKIRRLRLRCDSDMFVCLRNIFANEEMESIIIKEFSDLDNNCQDIYRIVAAMEASGVQVHRSLAMRVIGIAATYTSSVLQSLDGIIFEYNVSVKDGIYAWRGRHQVISEIVKKRKYDDESDLINLFDKVIDNINPSYMIERDSLNELCNVGQGIPALTSIQEQNRLYRKIISSAPNLRPPRHRLIRNLIKLGALPEASDEIKVFSAELGMDGPCYRYRSKIAVEDAKGKNNPLLEDKVYMIRRAAGICEEGIAKFKFDKALHSQHVEVGFELFKLNGDWSFYDAAMKELGNLKLRTLEPDVDRLIADFRRRYNGIVSGLS